MGFRTFLIASAACITGLACHSQAQAQSTPRGTLPDTSSPQAQAPGAGTGSALPQIRRPPGAPVPEIVERPPVRREVVPQTRKAVPSTTPHGVAEPAAKAAPAGDTANAAGTGAGAAAASAQASPHTWSPAEIEQARAHCSTVLRGVDAVMAPEDPIKDGECGSPVVFKVSSVSKGPAVELSPPVTLTCDMVAALDKWLKRDVQPQARSLLGGSIVKIDTMSSYSCRNAYGRTKTRLSEHGKANAIDIAGFSTAKETTTVLAGWGPTARELKAIAAKMEAERAAAAQAAARQGQQPQGSGTGSLPRVIHPPSAGGSMQTVPGVMISGPNGVLMPAAPGLGYGPSRLGGPKQPEAKVPVVVHGDKDPKRRFLREIHASACKHFGTVLGPEANNAHKNHFHLDMAPRQRGNFCE